MRCFALGLLASCLLSTPLMATPIQTVFVIGMENHDLTEPNGLTTAPEQIMGNVAAPFLNSLMTPGSPNAQYTSYATNMTNVAPGIHPSEPNYIWENGGSNFGVLADADPSAANHNIITSPSLTGLMTQKGVTWNSYQEDVQYSTSPLITASGTGGTHNGNTVTANPFNGTLQYNYGVKHNPMAFFSDSNSSPNASLTFSRLQTDLQNDTYAQYNWITPNQYNDMHSPLSGGFTYQGTLFTGDQAAVAQGDNFLALITPEIEATPAFQNGTGLIEIWFDESEGGDTSAFTIPEIIISKDAVGNAFDVTEPLTHNADLLSDEEIFHLGQCLGASCGSPDLSAFLQPGSIPNSVPEPYSLALLTAGLMGMGLIRRSHC
jgi:phosphatidylinositol-3-phosphatase